MCKFRKLELFKDILTWFSLFVNICKRARNSKPGKLRSLREPVRQKNNGKYRGEGSRYVQLCVRATACVGSQGKELFHVEGEEFERQVQM